MKEDETCVACGMSGKPVNGLTPVFIRDRKQRLLCLTCLADAVTDMAIGTQERIRHFERMKATPYPLGKYVREPGVHGPFTEIEEERD